MANHNWVLFPGDATDLQDFLPLSPPQVFNPETGSLSVREESQLSPRQRKILNKKLRASPLVSEENQASGDPDSLSVTGSKASKGERPESGVIRDESGQKASALPGIFISHQLPNKFFELILNALDDCN